MARVAAREDGEEASAICGAGGGCGALRGAHEVTANAPTPPPARKATTTAVRSVLLLVVLARPSFESPSAEEEEHSRKRG